MNLWKFNNEHYCLYTESKDVMNRIKRSYRDFKTMAEYYKDNKLIGIQYLIPASRLKSARRLSKIHA